MGLAWLFFVPCYLFLSLELAVAWTGWKVVLIGLALIATFLLVGYWNVNKRVRDLANPFRPMLSVEFNEDGLTPSWASRTQ